MDVADQLLGAGLGVGFAGGGVGGGGVDGGFVVEAVEVAARGFEVLDPPLGLFFFLFVSAWRFGFFGD